MTHMHAPEICFFMIVTEPDLVIADYAIRSYGRIVGLDFELRVCSNYIGPSLKQRYFPRWERLPYVRVLWNNHQDHLPRPVGPQFEGPFEKHGSILDRELKRQPGSLIAQVDADFEILDGGFVRRMVERFREDDRLGIMAVDGDLAPVATYDSFSRRTIFACRRLHTWFCIYRREALECPVSHAYREEQAESSEANVLSWDTSGWMQKAVEEQLGLSLEVLDAGFSSQFVHYSGFSKNQSVTPRNVGLYRQCRIVGRRGLPIVGRGRRLGPMLERLCFRGAAEERSHYPDGYAQP